MKDELITLETAKLAKEKGFNWKVSNYHRIISGTGQTVINSQLCDMNSSPFNERYFSLPTQSLLQRWLREEHKIHITVDITEKEGKYYYYLNGNMITAFNTKIELDVVYVTYEEALEEGLKNALNEI